MPRERRHSSSSSSDEDRGDRRGSSGDRRSDSRARDKEQRRRDKERMKELETPAEKRARRIAKKAAKALKRTAGAASNDFLGYTNTDNPFGDANLTEQFVWGKKREVLEKKGLSAAEQARLDLERRIAHRAELEAVKKAREDREREKEARELEETLTSRTSEDAHFQAWMAQEDQFHLTQARLRSEIRVRDGRAKPIDVLALYISKSEDDSSTDIDLHEPYVLLDTLPIEDLEDLLEDILVYLTMDKGRNDEFWADMQVLCEHLLAEQKRARLKCNPSAKAAEKRAAETGVHDRVAVDIKRMLHGKANAQLQLLHTEITRRVQKGDAVDVGYWETLLTFLEAELARARLRELHQRVLQRKLTILRHRQVDGDAQGAQLQATLTATLTGPAAAAAAAATTSSEAAAAAAAVVDQIPDAPEPPLLAMDDLEAADSVSRSALDDRRMLAYVRRIVAGGGRAPPSAVALAAIAPRDPTGAPSAAAAAAADDGASGGGAADLFGQVAASAAGNEGESFSDEVALQSQTYQWADKYRPRKPRFFNRVHTGFEWNKYNQTHYDTDNPPPKVVQGYKFNIFYPDLIDRFKTPEYTVTRCADDPGFSIIRFHAGPPYEDLAFKIVDRPWEYAHRHGFRAQFNNGIFQCWFHFKRDRYRR